MTDHNDVIIIGTASLLRGARGRSAEPLEQVVADTKRVRQSR
jgi:hypothetical protein